MHIIVLVLTILYVLGFFGRYAPNGAGYVWIGDSVGAALLLCLALIYLGVFR